MKNVQPVPKEADHFGLPDATALAERLRTMKAKDHEALSTRAWQTLEFNVAMVKYIDGKAFPILGVAGGLISVLVKAMSEKESKEAILASVPLTLGIVATTALIVGSVGFALLAGAPQLNLRQISSWRWRSDPVVHDEKALTSIYFGHIAAHPNAAEYAVAAQTAMDDESRYLAEIYQQIYVNAEIAKKKARRIHIATLLLIYGLGMGVLTSIVYFVLK